MATFTLEIKRELLAETPENGHCAALFAALLHTCGQPAGASSCEIVSENERVAEYMLALSERLGVKMRLKEVSRDPKRRKDRLVFIAEEALPPAFSDEEDGQEALAYLRGAFLGGGNCTLPRSGAKTGYHLEILFSDRAYAEAFCRLLERFELLGRTLPRGERCVVYVKSREGIADFLSVIGARSALKKYEKLSHEREISNNENRLNNCFIGNTDKTATASAVLIVALREMEAAGLIQTLPDRLKEVAAARVEYPTLSLSELSKRLGISKSCLNHRMRKLMQIHAEAVKRS